VVDKTGLTGTFDFTLEFAPETNDRRTDDGTSLAPQSAGPTFYEALREQLGLKLVTQKGLVDVIVIETRVELATNDQLQGVHAGSARMRFFQWEMTNQKKAAMRTSSTAM
jgi:uncharacterized protein DUF3738